MKQFDLSLWLKDNSRKVVTRRGNPVRIICIDRKHGKDELPIVFLEENNGGEFLLTCRNDGRSDNYDTQYDLFFADEEEELTEFEKVLKEVIEDVQNGDYIEEESFGFWKDRLLDLARKELQPEIDKELDEAYKSRDEVVYLDGYDKGYEDALKDLPKWKKATEKKDLEKHIAIIEENKVLLSNYLEEDDYYIELNDLRTLPKEE